MDKKQITDAVDKIEPSAGAKERMLKHIYQKADANKNNETVDSPAKPSFFKAGYRKLLPLCACFMLLCIAGTVWMTQSSLFPLNNDTIFQGTPGSATADDIAKLGYEISLPDGAENFIYSIYDGNIASIDFTYNSCVYTLTVSSKSGDLSGIDGDVIRTVSIDSSVNATLSQVDNYGSISWKAHWTDGRVNWFLTNTDGVSENEITALCLELISK